MEEKKYPTIVIIGAGLSGLATAYFLSKHKVPYLLFEQENEIGGLCRTVKVNDFRFDYTGHLLHTSHDETRTVVKELLGKNCNRCVRDSWIFSSGVFTRYPFQSHTFGLPRRIQKACVFGYLDAYMKQRTPEQAAAYPPHDFVSWVLLHFGKGIAEHFMFPYNKKLWATDIKKLTTHWLKGYVPQPNLSDVINGAFEDTRDEGGYNAAFYYPKHGGIQTLITRMREQIAIAPTCNARVQAVNYKSKEIVVNGKKQQYDFLVSSAPLKMFAEEIVTNAPRHIKRAAHRLAYNRVFNLNLGVGRTVSEKHWIYFPEKQFCFYRVGFNSNFGNDSAPSGMSALYTEVSCAHDVKPDDARHVAHTVVRDLIKADILSKHDVIKAMKVFHIAPAYVLYDTHRETSVGDILSFFGKQNILCVGRYGRWEYSAMEDAILDGKRAARAILQRMG